jgi:phage terminase large subunit
LNLRELGIKYRQLPSQKRFHRSKAKFKAYVGGYGSGKTFAGCHEAIRLSALNAGLTGMMLAPTYRMLEDATLPAFIGILEKSGIAYSYKSSTGKMRLPWGSDIIFRSAENPDRLKGPNLAWVGIDEGAMVSKEAWDVAISRIRHPEAKKLSAFITTTPEGFNWLYEEFVEKRRRGYEVIHARTEENHYLPQEYVRDLAEAYDPALVRQYLMGEFVDALSGRVYRFNRDAHVRGGLCYSPARPLLLAVDFNVDPMHAAVIQVDGPLVMVVDEVVLSSSNTYELCEEVRSRYPDAHVVAYPDPSGRARKTSGATGLQSDFAILMQAGFEVRARNSHPAVKDRVNAVNRKLTDAAGQPGIAVSDKCRETIRSFEQTSYKPGSTVIDKDRSVEHMTDAIGYLIEYEYPVRPPARVDYMGIRRGSSSRGF